MTTEFNMLLDSNGKTSFLLPLGDFNYQALLATNTDTAITTPAFAELGTNTPTLPTLAAIFTYTPGSDVWVSVNNAATFPVSAAFSVTTCAQNPPGLVVKGGDVIHFITSGMSVGVGVRFYVKK